jgi:5-carboxymethyl-2-hydroxymuconate isomerase
MKLYLGLTESSAPHQTRIFAESEHRLIDLRLAYSACLTQRGQAGGAYELAEFYFPETLAAFLERGAEGEAALNEVSNLLRAGTGGVLRGPRGEKISYAKSEIRLLPPFPKPEKSFVIGFSDRARSAAMPPAEIPTAFYKLPQTFITTGAPIVWPRFSTELDADACLAVVIGKAGKRISAEDAWSHVAGATLLIDITARDVNRREGLTTNNLLGKNFPSSTALGPAFLPVKSAPELAALEIELALDGSVKQKFTLGQCVFGVEQMITRWSILGVKPGDFLAIGASMARESERLGSAVPVKIGTTLTCSAPAIGELSHQVVAAGEARP